MEQPCGSVPKVIVSGKNWAEVSLKPGGNEWFGSVEMAWQVLTVKVWTGERRINSSEHLPWYDRVMIGVRCWLVGKEVAGWKTSHPYQDGVNDFEIYQDWTVRTKRRQLRHDSNTTISGLIRLLQRASWSNGMSQKCLQHFFSNGLYISSRVNFET